VPGKRLKEGLRIACGQLAAHVDQVIDPQRARRLEAVQHLQQAALVVGAEALGVGVAHANGIEYRGDAGRRHLGIVRLHGARHREAHLGPRRDVALEVVGVDLHQAWQQPVTLQVNGAGQRARGQTIA